MEDRNWKTNAALAFVPRLGRPAGAVPFGVIRPPARDEPLNLAVPSTGISIDQPFGVPRKYSAG